MVGGQYINGLMSRLIYVYNTVHDYMCIRTAELVCGFKVIRVSSMSSLFAHISSFRFPMKEQPEAEQVWSAQIA